MSALLTPAEVAQALGVTVATLKDWRIDRRELWQHVKIGRRVMYRAESVEAYIASKSVA